MEVEKIEIKQNPGGIPRIHVEGSFEHWPNVSVNHMLCSVIKPVGNAGCIIEVGGKHYYSEEWMMKQEKMTIGTMNFEKVTRGCTDVIEVAGVKYSPQGVNGINLVESGRPNELVMYVAYDYPRTKLEIRKADCPDRAIYPAVATVYLPKKVGDSVGFNAHGKDSAN
jgi:hypothetical protein